MEGVYAATNMHIELESGSASSTRSSFRYMSRSKPIPPSPWKRYIIVFLWAWVSVVLVAYFFVDDVQEAAHHFIQQLFDAP